MYSDIIHFMFMFYKHEELAGLERGERIGGAQQHQRLVASLNKHIQQNSDRLAEVSPVALFAISFKNM